MRDDNIRFMGIEIGGTKLQVVMGDADGHIEQQIRYPIDASDGASGIQAHLQKSFDKLNSKNMGAVGVGFGGPVNWKTGVIQTSHQIGGWNNFALKDWLQEQMEAPVVIDNDANVAALAEAIHGAGKGHNPVFYMTIGSGIGGGLVVNETIYHGATRGEVEIGHIRLSKSGNTLESACSGWSVNKKIRTYVKQHPNSLLAQLASQNNTPEAALLQPALEKRDFAAQEIIMAIADNLAFALSHVVHLFHPQTIIIGGGLSLLGADLRDAITERLPHYIMKAFLPAPVVQIASLGENVVPVGALELAKRFYLETKK